MILDGGVSAWKQEGYQVLTGGSIENEKEEEKSSHSSSREAAVERNESNEGSASGDSKEQAPNPDDEARADKPRKSSEKSA